MSKVYKHWRDYPMSEWRWPNFSPEEMACRGTGRLMIVPSAMDKLQALRDRLGKPLIVNSAYRSLEHNRRVGGAKRSKHMEGIAFDVRMDNLDPDVYITAALSVGFNAIGTYPKQNFVHVDARPNRANWGKPFPKREQTPNFAVEIPREPETVAEDGQSKGLLAGLGGLGLSGAGILSGLGNLDPKAQIIVLGGFGVAAVVMGVLFRKRLARLAE